jgi:CheY-like chemotaxis protein
MNEILGNTAELFGKTKNDIIIHSTYQDGIWAVDVGQSQIEYALLILYVNAWQTMSGTKELYLQTQNVTLDENDAKQYFIKPGGYVKSSVTDTGAGLDGLSQQRLFDTFLDTAQLDAGRKLGLALAYGIIKSHGGTITAYSEKGAGTTFNIYLPISAQEFIQELEFAEQLSPGSETVLLVDDEEMIIDVGREMLAKLGYKVLTAQSGREAIEIYRQNKKKIDIVILDVIMPGLHGGETYDQLKTIDPNVDVLLASGYGLNKQIGEILERGCNGFIQKPFNMKQLSRNIREILDR